MDDLDFTISASGDFGNFMLEYPDNIKELFQKLLEMKGEKYVQLIMEEQKIQILMLLYAQHGAILSGRLAQTLSKNITKHLGEISEEGLKLIRSSK